MTIQRVSMVLDLQYGSTGKGLIATKYALDERPDTVMAAFGPNAGHTGIDYLNTKFIHLMLPNGSVSTSVRQVLIGPGSVIEPDALLSEYKAMVEYRGEFSLIIHPHAAVVTQEHRDLESGPMTKIGSTKKGVGEALIQRIRRNPDNQNVACKALDGHELGKYVTTVEGYNNAVDHANHVLIESAQGFNLSMYHGFYPYTTSRDVSTAQVLADVALPFNVARNMDVIGTLRTFPIRVANRFDENGSQVGWSGPHYPDQQELAWSDIGRKAELTTVTKLPRRIFTFSMQQTADAVRQTGAGHLFLNFANYLNTAQEIADLINKIDTALIQDLAFVRWVGFGPGCHDVVDLESEEWSSRGSLYDLLSLKLIDARMKGQ